MYAQVGMPYHGLCVEVREQLLGVNLFFHHVAPEEQPTVARLSGKRFTLGILLPALI